MTLARVAALVGIALGVLVIDIALSIVYMVVYGHVIDPGHERAYYDAHINVAAPYCSIVAGIPLMFLAGWWVAGWDTTHGVRLALIVWAAYAVIDLAMVIASGVILRIGLLIAVSLLTKLVAVYLGAVFR